jgi:TIR domain
MQTEMPRIFFSYARADSEFVLKLARDLRSAGTSLWLDQVDIHGGDFWERAVEEALTASSGLLVVLSPTSVASPNVMDEVSFALENKKKIVPVVYHKCDIPFRLKRLQYIDFTVDYNHGLTQLLSALNVVQQFQTAQGTALATRAREAAFDVSPSRSWINARRLIYLLVAGFLAAVIGISFWIYESRPMHRILGVRVDSARTISIREEQRKKWRQVTANLRILIRNIRGADDGFRGTIKDANSDEDIWTTAQCVSALIAVGDLLRKHSDLKKSFEWIQGQKNDNGWYRNMDDPRDPAPNTEITAWVGLGYLLGLSEPSLFNTDAEQQKAKADLASVYTILSNRQSHSGGWASYPTRYESSSAFGDYATFMAMEFLLSLMREKGGGIADPDTLIWQIEKGVDWILSEYNYKTRGWEDSAGSGSTMELSTMYLLVLVSAKELGLEPLGNLIELNKGYQNASRNWLNHTLEVSEKRSMSDNPGLKQQQKHYGADDALIIRSIPVTVVWYPWALLLATNMASDNVLPVRDRELAFKIAIKLWERLPETVRTFDTGESFLAAETLYALGLIGQKYGWIVHSPE